LKLDKVIGLVNATYIVNNSCKDCFGTDLYKKQFQSMGVNFQNETTVDISTSGGKEFLKKYNITSIPALVLSKGISDYGYLAGFLNQTGTFEKGGEFVFRNLDGFGKKYQKIE
jgi:thioredoxin-related protein